MQYPFIYDGRHITVQLTTNHQPFHWEPLREPIGMLKRKIGDEIMLIKKRCMICPPYELGLHPGPTIPVPR